MDNINVTGIKNLNYDCRWRIVGGLKVWKENEFYLNLYIYTCSISIMLMCDLINCVD